MPISIITNFDVNTSAPIDSRLVATNSAALSEISFPYEGLTVFTKEQNLNYTYNGTPPFGTWQVSSNGVYGGSGSLVGNTDVSAGSVGTSQNDKSFEYIISASSSSDRVQYATSFIRSASGNEYTSVEVRNQVRFFDDTRGLLNGPYISFNGNPSKNGIVSLGTPDRNLSTTVERFRIEPDSTSNNGAIVLIPSTYSYPLYVSQKAGVGTFIGYNWDGTSKLINGTSSSYISFVGGQISFFSSNYLFNTNFSEVLRVGNIQGPDSSTGGDSVTIRTDVSSNYMDTTVLRDYSFLSIPSAVRNIEHKYTKTQHLNYAELRQYGIGDQDVKTMKEALAQDNLVIITNEGNFFDFELPVDYTRTVPYRIHNIQICRPNFDDGPDYIFDVPAGTEIKIRFTYESDPMGITTRIYLWQSTSDNNIRKIKSSYADTNGGEYITILHNTGSTDLAERNEIIAGDIITFTKGGNDFWYVTNINREKQIIKSISSSITWNTISSVSDYIRPQSPLRRIAYQSNYYWVDDNTSTLNINVQSTGANIINHPLKHIYAATGGIDYNTVSWSKPLRIAKDSYGKVYIKGSFQITNIPFTSLTKAYQTGISNKFYIANIQNSEWFPPSSISSPPINIDASSWGLCEVIVSCSTSAGMPFAQGNGSSGAVFLSGRISIDLSGRVFLQFNMGTWGLTVLAGIYTIDVNVPEFYYSTILE